MDEKMSLKESLAKVTNLRGITHQFVWLHTNALAFSLLIESKSSKTEYSVILTREKSLSLFSYSNKILE